MVASYAEFVRKTAAVLEGFSSPFGWFISLAGITSRAAAAPGEPPPRASCHVHYSTINCCSTPAARSLRRNSALVAKGCVSFRYFSLNVKFPKKNFVCEHRTHSSAREFCRFFSSPVLLCCSYSLSLITKATIVSFSRFNQVYVLFSLPPPLGNFKRELQLLQVCGESRLVGPARPGGGRLGLRAAPRRPDLCRYRFRCQVSSQVCVAIGLISVAKRGGRRSD